MAFRSSIERSVLVAALCIGSLTSPAWAQDTSAAETELRRGVALRREGKEAEALDAFQHSYDLSPTPRALAQKVLAEQALSLWLAAERDLAAALAADDDAWIKQNRGALEGAMKLVHSKLGWITVTTNVPGAAVSWNGSLVTPDAEHRVRVIAGEGVLDTRADGYQPHSRTLRIAPETVQRVRVDLKPVPSTGLAPVTALPPARAPSEPTPVSPRRWVGWGVLAGGVAAVGVGAVFGGLAMAHKSERDDDCAGGCSQLGVDADRAGRSAGRLSTVLVAAGAVGVGTGAVLLLTAPKRTASPRASLRMGGPSVVFSCSF